MEDCPICEVMKNSWDILKRRKGDIYTIEQNIREEIGKLLEDKKTKDRFDVSENQKVDKILCLNNVYLYDYSLYDALMVKNLKLVNKFVHKLFEDI